MEATKLPPIPPFPAVAALNADRARWIVWAQKYALEAVRLEREKCALICEAVKVTDQQMADRGGEQERAFCVCGNMVADMLAAAIRAQPK